jgi:acyl carrier protein
MLDPDFPGGIMTDNMNKLQDCFVNALGIDRDKVVDGLTYNSIKQWDSVGHMALMTEVETVFDVMLDTDDILNLSSVAKTREILAKYGVTF